MDVEVLIFCSLSRIFSTMQLTCECTPGLGSVQMRLQLWWNYCLDRILSVDHVTLSALLVKLLSRSSYRLLLSFSFMFDFFGTIFVCVYVFVCVRAYVCVCVFGAFRQAFNDLSSRSCPCFGYPQ